MLNVVTINHQTWSRAFLCGNCNLLDISEDLLTIEEYHHGFDSCLAADQAYARKMNKCLLETTHSGNSPAIMQELLQWSSQVNSLIVFLAVGNVKNFVAYTGSRLDGNVGPNVSQLPDSWYHSFTVRPSQKIACD